jgi:hypothetical protein
MTLALKFQSDLIGLADTGDADGGRAILRVLSLYDLGELEMIDGLLTSAEKWIRADIETGSNAHVIELCGVLIAKGVRASHAGSTEAAIGYFGETLCILDTLADCGDERATEMMERLTDWMGASGLAKAVLARAKAMRAEMEA